MYECRCDERLTVKTEGSTRLTCTGVRGTGTPNDSDEVYNMLSFLDSRSDRG
jgi:hypothetical protein